MEETFKEWMAKVDAILEAKIGLGTSDMRDRCYWDAWNDELSPEEFVMDEWGEDAEEMMENEIFG